MKNNTNYFSHDGNAHEDTKCLELKMHYGLQGYGLYRELVERLFNEGGKLLLSKCKAIAYQLHISTEDFENIFNTMIDIGLLKKDSEYFWSDSLMTRIQYKNEIKEKRRSAGRRGGLVSQSKNKQMLSNCSSKIDQSKVKESKVKDNKEYIPPEKSGGTKNIYSDAFEQFWNKYPHARKGKKKDSYKYFKDNNVDDVMQEVLLLNWKIKFGLEDGKYMPACERWIRDFTVTSESIKDQDIKNIVDKLMKMDKGEKRSEYVKGLNNDFGKDTIDKLVKEWNQNKNGITLNLK